MMAGLPTDPPLHHRICAVVLTAFVCLACGMEHRVAHAQQMQAAKPAKKTSLTYPVAPPTAKRGQVAAKKRPRSDARAGPSDRLRLHQSPRVGCGPGANLLFGLDARSRQGDLRRKHQAAPCRGQRQADRSGR